MSPVPRWAALQSRSLAPPRAVHRAAAVAVLRAVARPGASEGARPHSWKALLLLPCFSWPWASSPSCRVVPCRSNNSGAPARVMGSGVLHVSEETTGPAAGPVVFSASAAPALRRSGQAAPQRQLWGALGKNPPPWACPVIRTQDLTLPCHPLGIRYGIRNQPQKTDTECGYGIRNTDTDTEYGPSPKIRIRNTDIEYGPTTLGPDQYSVSVSVVCIL
jgi:hypothetical protein